MWWYYLQTFRDDNKGFVSSSFPSDGKKDIVPIHNPFMTVDFSPSMKLALLQWGGSSAERRSFNIRSIDLNCNI